jgi:pyrimidine-nucleoside phosphorylase
MVHSGEVLDLSAIPEPKVDKHSTGGVGDKTSLVLAPLAAELGLCVPMMSGRGLGHTTGTLDKLEAIPGFSTQVSLQEFRSVLEKIGVAMIGQTGEIAPLDRRLYALRDATATVPSIPLIAASIMSKKLAEGLDALVLDVKTGEGAFIQELPESVRLAETMARLGAARGVSVTALVTRMDAPLGRAVGNGLETAEALACLSGEGPDDLAAISARIVGEMLFLGGLAESALAGETRATKALAAGRGLDRMARLIELQGGDPKVADDPGRIPRAPCHAILEGDRAGYVEGVVPTALGHGVVSMGGGRRAMDDPIDLSVGFVVHVRPGDSVEPGAPLGEVHGADEDTLELGLKCLRGAVAIGESPPADPPAIVAEVVQVLPSNILFADGG